MTDLRSGSEKSRQGEIAVFCHERDAGRVKTNQYRGDSEPFSVPYSTNDTVDRTEQETQLDREMHNRIGDSTSGAASAAIPSPGLFPLRTLIVCFTIWLIATQALIFDQLKFDARAHLFEQATRPLGVPQAVAPSERPSNLPSGAKVERL